MPCSYAFHWSWWEIAFEQRLLSAPYQTTLSFVHVHNPATEICQSFVPRPDADAANKLLGWE